ncbi:transposase [Streptomyces sp. NPDC004779]
MILHRVRTGVEWRDLPDRFGPWKPGYEHPLLRSADGTWERLLQQVQAAARSTGTSRSTPPLSARTHRGSGSGIEGAEQMEQQAETPWQRLVAHLVEVVLEVSAWAARGVGSPASST